jgi:hypothetical protein
MDKMIYAILSSKNNLSEVNVQLATIKGISGANLYAVTFDEILAVVSDIKRNTLCANQSNALEYAGVIENLAQQFNLLPVRFGSLMESTEEIIKVLQINYKGIAQNLQKVDNRCEFGLRIFCDSDKLKESLKAKSEVYAVAPTKPASERKKSIYLDYVNKKLKEHRLEEQMLNYVDSVIEEITGCVDRLNAVNKFKKMATATNIIDAVFLLVKDRKAELVKTVEDLQTQHPSLNFVLTGPWPPYNFVDFTIK